MDDQSTSLVLLEALVSAPRRDGRIRAVMSQDPSWIPEHGPRDPHLWAEMVHTRDRAHRWQAAARIDSLEVLDLVSASTTQIGVWIGLVQNPLASCEEGRFVYERAIAFGRSQSESARKRLATAMGAAPYPPWSVVDLFLAEDWLHDEVPQILDGNPTWCKLPVDRVERFLGVVSLPSTFELGLALACSGTDDPGEPDSVLAIAERHGIYYRSYGVSGAGSYAYATWLVRQPWEIQRRALQIPQVAGVVAVLVDALAHARPWAQEAEALASRTIVSMHTRGEWSIALGHALREHADVRLGRPVAEALVSLERSEFTRTTLPRLTPEAAAAVWRRMSPRDIREVLCDIEDPKEAAAAFAAMARDRGSSMLEFQDWLRERPRAFFDALCDAEDPTAAFGLASGLLVLHAGSWGGRSDFVLPERFSHCVARSAGPSVLEGLVPLLDPSAHGTVVERLMDRAVRPPDPNEDRRVANGWNELRSTVLASVGHKLDDDVVATMCQGMDCAQLVALAAAENIRADVLSAVASSCTDDYRQELMCELQRVLHTERITCGPALYDEALRLTPFQLERMVPGALERVDTLLAAELGDNAEQWEVVLGLLPGWTDTLGNLVESARGVAPGTPAS